MDERGGGITIFCRKLFVSQCQKISYEKPFVLCFRKFPVAKNFMHEREGEYQDFPSNVFCLTVPKISVGEPFSVSLSSGIEKFYVYEGNITNFENFWYRKNLCFSGLCHYFPSKICCLTVPKNFVR